MSLYGNGSNSPAGAMSYVAEITGMDADQYGASSGEINGEHLDFLTFPVCVPKTHIPGTGISATLLGTGENTMFWAPPLAGDETVFQQLSTELQDLYNTGTQSAVQSDTETDDRLLTPQQLKYSSAQEAKAARRGRPHEVEPVANPSFPTTNEQDQLYVAKLFNACGSFTRTLDNEKTLGVFKSKVHRNPERVEQACWDLLDATKLYHIRNGAQHTKSYRFAGNFSAHIASLCDDLLSGSKTACNTVCGVFSGIDAMVDDPGKRKKDTDSNRAINKGRQYLAKPKKAKGIPIPVNTTPAAATPLSAAPGLAHQGPPASSSRSQAPKSPSDASKGKMKVLDTSVGTLTAAAASIEQGPAGSSIHQKPFSQSIAPATGGLAASIIDLKVPFAAATPSRHNPTGSFVEDQLPVRASSSPKRKRMTAEAEEAPMTKKQRSIEMPASEIPSGLHTRELPQPSGLETRDTETAAHTLAIAPRNLEPSETDRQQIQKDNPEPTMTDDFDWAGDDTTLFGFNLDNIDPTLISNDPMSDFEFHKSFQDSAIDASSPAPTHLSSANTDSS